MAPTLFETIENALKLAGSGQLSVIDLFSAAQLLADAGNPDVAINLYRVWLANTESPIAYAVQFNLGVLLMNAKDDAGAELCYRAAIAQKPTFIEGHMNLGTLLERQKQPQEALAMWRAVLPIADINNEADRKFHVQALNNLGRLLEILKDFNQAELMLQKSLQIDPNQPNVMTHWVHLRQKQCAWPVYDGSIGVPIDSMVHGTSALAMLSASGDPELQLVAARRYVKEKVLAGVEALSDKRGYDHNKLRIGYLSSDFQSHAVSILTAEVYELHDRARVEVFAFCWSNEDGSPLRARVVGAMDHYIRIADMSDEDAAKVIRSHEIDILVDLHGLTLGTRPNILSYRPAPIQVTWLGLPGPTGLPSIDYVIADDFVLPRELEPYFTEKPLRLPNCFQSNDRKREIGPRPTRADSKLPEDQFVFCSFNNSFKINPDMFAVWMRILKRAPNSVLWLVGDNQWVRENLCMRAEEHGVARERLLFAERVPPAQYLARFQIADLFLDTFPFGGGTTASDALWAGLPLLTYTGRTFSSRMAGSLLRAVDLPDLITYTLADYEDKAVELANDPARVAAMKKQLVENRLSCALFDTPRFVRDLEDAFEKVVRRPGKDQYLPAVIQTGRDRLEHFDALNAGIVFALWLGPYVMSPERSAAVQSIFRDAARPVCFITDATLADYEHPNHPFHPAFRLLSEVHRADYLRCYLMHHYGGGYTDIKPVLQPWTNHFRAFDDANVLALGYPEISATAVAQLPGELGEQLRIHYAELIGYCSMVFRRRTALTGEWMMATHKKLDELLPALKEHPARHPMDQTGVKLPNGEISQYPLAWTVLGGNIFHPMILKYRDKVVKTDAIKPQLHGYR
ncbi:MAG: tetratricopeptide repeat protein [Pseudomonadota bacterium]